MNVKDLSLYPNSNLFGTCSYNTKPILLCETRVMEAQVYFGSSGFTAEIEITICSAVADFYLPCCLPSFVVDFRRCCFIDKAPSFEDKYIYFHFLT